MIADVGAIIAWLRLRADNRVVDIARIAEELVSDRNTEISLYRGRAFRFPLVGKSNEVSDGR